MQALNMRVEWGIFGKQSTWNEPALSWIELWSKNLLLGFSWLLPMKEKSASRVLLEEASAIQAANAESGQAVRPSSEEARERSAQYSPKDDYRELAHSNGKGNTK